MKDRKRDLVIIEKVLRYCDEIEKTHAAFRNDKDLFFNKEEGFIYRNSITMPILQIGELVKNLSAEFVAEHNSIPWKAIAGMRDVFAHHYGSIDYDMTWNTSVEDVPALKEYLVKVQYDNPNSDTILAIQEVETLKKDPNKKVCSSFSEISEELADDE
ncbi:MAG: DUF86 domain-containing protein [Oscillospiraceae bacterium]|nr:DUF86 domain-containing protein [Oscillospiraceae bacterium]